MKIFGLEIKTTVTRLNPASFPVERIKYVNDEGDIESQNVDMVVTDFAGRHCIELNIGEDEFMTFDMRELRWNIMWCKRMARRSERLSKKRRREERRNK